MSRVQSERGAHEGFDLLRVGGFRALVLWKGFPYVFQGILLVCLVGLILISWGVHAPEGSNGKLFAKTNLVTLLVWGLWWPAMVWVAVLLGRAWCMICPLELVSNLSERLARALGLTQRALRRWLASGALIVGLYFLSQILVMGLHLHRSPAYTSVFLAGLLTVAALSGLLWKDRAFCRGFCPVGLLLGTYGRGGMLAVRPGPSPRCKECNDKGCVLAANRTRLDARSCPSLLNPPRLDSNEDCLLCGQCIKACSSHNMQFLLRRPFPASDRRDSQSSWPVTLFVMLASGFVLWELFTEWPAAERTFLFPAAWLAGSLGWEWATGWFEGVWTLLVVPPVLWLLLGSVSRVAGSGDSMGQLWRRLALPLAVVVAAGHMSKGLAKLVSWSPFLPQALRDPGGAETVVALSARTPPTPAVLMSLEHAAWLGLGVVVVGSWFAVREYRLANHGGGPWLRAVAPIGVLALGFSAVIAGWALQ